LDIAGALEDYLAFAIAVLFPERALGLSRPSASLWLISGEIARAARSVLARSSNHLPSG
jgi:hypothetical protein